MFVNLKVSSIYRSFVNSNTLKFHYKLSNYNKMSLFTQNLNPITGTTCWEEKDPDYDYHQEVARSAFADMLHDHERNEKYFIALKAAIDKKHSLGQKANVLDIGTGTGLLSMMAVKCGADSVTACEAFKPMAKCALKIIQDNGYSDKIKLILKRSTEITVGENNCDMLNRANILVTEVFDTELIGEGALSTFQHAHKVLLEKDSIVVPDRGTVWAQVIESPMVRAWNRIDPILNSLGDKILIDTPSAAKTCGGAAAVHDLQLSQLSRELFKPLTSPIAVCRFDWSGKTPLVFKEKFYHTVKPIASGTAHAVFMWWDLNMDTEGKVLLSCAPVWEHPDVKLELKKGRSLDELREEIPWRDHWMQAVYYLSPEYHIAIEKDLTLITSHDEYSFWYHLSDGSRTDDQSERPICECFIHLAYSRTRIGQLNDKIRAKKYIQALEKQITKDSVCLCLSDGSLFALAAAKLGAKKVIILESSSLSRKAMEMYIKTNKLLEKVEIISSREELNASHGVNLIFGEPNFVTSIVPWDNIHFWHLSSKYPSNILKIPKTVTIKGVAVEFKDLHKIRAPLGICEGFDLSTFDKLVQASSDISDNPIEAHPLWEYPGKALSDSFKIVEFEFDKNMNEESSVKVSDRISLTNDGTCNGIALWAEWNLDDEITVSTGPSSGILSGKNISWDPHTRQGVYLPRNTSAVNDKNHLLWSINFSPLNGDVNFQFKIV